MSRAWPRNILSRSPSFEKLVGRTIVPEKIMQRVARSAEYWRGCGAPDGRKFVLLEREHLGTGGRRGIIVRRQVVHGHPVVMGGCLDMLTVEPRGSLRCDCGRSGCS